MNENDIEVCDEIQEVLNNEIEVVNKKGKVQCTFPFLFVSELRLSSSFFDFCFFTSKFSEVENTSSTNFTSLI